MAAAMAALFGLWGADAMALSLGRITVQSALGEPLRAEIDIPDINTEEAASLKTTLAMPEAFRAAGLEYSPVMSDLQISLQKKPDGHVYIRLYSDKTVNEPFVDLMIEVRWASGRIVRDYTMLFDPPTMRQPVATPPITAAQITAPSAPSRIAPAQALIAPTVRTSPVSPRPAVARKPAAATVETAAKEPHAVTKQVTVRSGDTASRIAVTTKPVGVSLDQMLVALLRANPDAFIGGNINRVKAGAVLHVPSSEQALAIPAHEATQTVIAQSRDFNDFRRKLASSAPAAQVAEANRQARGQVQARVEEKKPVTAAPDKLTLSKGTVQGKPAALDRIAKERADKEAASRTAELSKNISELNQLAVTSGTTAPGPVASASSSKGTGSTPAMAVPIAAVPTSPVAPTSAAASPVRPASAATARPAAATPKTAASAPVKRPVAATPMPGAEPSLLDDLLENPFLPAAGGGLIALLAGLGFYRMRQRKKATQVDSSFLESRLQPDSFFGTSGGQRVDTHDGNAAESSQLYSPSQLDTADEVDPVAEADVYLAYGRDLQAEEILKEALRTHPARVALHQKLLEIYAKRRDLKGFESMAQQARQLTGAEGPIWAHICQLGLGMDPGNALYQPDGQHAVATSPAAEPNPEGPNDFFDTPAQQPDLAQAPPPIDLDLDLDFSLDTAPEGEGASNKAEPTASMPAADESAPPSFAMDLDLATDAPEAPDTESPQAEPESNDFALPDLELASDELSLPPVSTPRETARETTSPEDSGMLEFDLGSLSLDLGSPVETPPAAPEPAPEDPLATKLALAEEFSAIGDTDGARTLIEEIIAEASGDMKARAQRALSQLT